MTVLNHRHSRAAYRSGEGRHCLLCRAANAEYESERTRRQAYGQPTTNLIDSAPVRAHLKTLQAAGMGWRRIAAQAGCNQMTVRRLLGYKKVRPARRVRPDTAARLLAVQPDTALVDAGPTWRRIHGMIAAGYTRQWISRQLGHTTPGLQLSRSKVTRHTAQLIEELAERCALQPGPSDRARAEARRHGWTVDLLWEDLTGGSDKYEVIDTVAVARAAAGDRTVTLTRAERRAVIARLAAQGWKTWKIADWLRMNHDTVRRQVSRLQQQSEDEVA